MKLTESKFTVSTAAELTEEQLDTLGEAVANEVEDMFRMIADRIQQKFRNTVVTYQL